MLAMFTHILQRVTRRYATPLFGFLMLSIAMAGCANTIGGGYNNGNANAPIVNSATTPTPDFPKVTMGAWVSNQTPLAGDNIVVYVVIRSHTYDIKNPQPPQAVPGVSVSISFNGSAPPQTTDQTGLAAFPIQAQGNPGTPVIVNVSATAQGVNLRTDTFYTVLPGSASPTPSTSPTPSP
jgi:hypothetical protein